MKNELKILLMISALLLAAAGLLGPIYAVYVQEIGGDLLTAGTSYAVFAISAGLLTFLFGRWEDRVDHQEKFIIAHYLLAAIGYFGYIVAKTPTHLFIIQAVFGIGMAMGAPAYDGVYSRYMDKGKYASQWGTWEAMHWIVTAIAAALGGLLANLYGFKVLFMIMFALSIIALLVSLLLIKKK